MSTQRFGNDKVISAEYLNRRGAFPHRIVSDTIADALYEIQRHTGVGEEVAWDTLRLTVEPERRMTTGLKIHAEVEVFRDDVVAGLNAIALAEHEREKTRRP